MADTNDHQPLVAVVTPVYNGQPYLARTLACVQAQTYANLVHVVLDNASTDDTPSAIAATVGGRVPIITQCNASLLPQVENWNAAVAMTPPQARYVKLLPADDLMRADCIERLVAVAEANPSVHCVTAVDVFEDRVKPHGLDPRRSVFEGREIVQRILRGQLHWLPNHHVFFRTTPERLVRPFDPAVNPGFDSDFILRLLLQGEMGFVNAPLLYTRYHKSTVTADYAAHGALLYTLIAAIRRYGGDLLSPSEYKRQCDAQLRLILRHVLIWQLTGKTQIAARNLQHLAELGFKPSALDYLACILTWPPHKLRKTIREIADRAVSPRRRMTEADFLQPISR
ncbi:MAG: glycosyltransferase family 2 protein [Hyphomonadaceae bacterium]|jgi:glycosyltransferase involved in cell wall biosynthesis|nr:glycosyltransferase family 2 protein [Hyphomonadaceae bacterium]